MKSKWRYSTMHYWTVSFFFNLFLPFPNSNTKITIHFLNYLLLTHTYCYPCDRLQIKFNDALTLRIKTFRSCSSRNFVFWTPQKMRIFWTINDIYSWNCTLYFVLTIHDLRKNINRFRLIISKCRKFKTLNVKYPENC